MVALERNSSWHCVFRKRTATTSTTLFARLESMVFYFGTWCHHGLGCKLRSFSEANIFIVTYCQEIGVDLRKDALPQAVGAFLLLLERLSYWPAPQYR